MYKFLPINKLKRQKTMNSSRRDFIKSASMMGAGAVFIPNLMSCSPSGRLNIAVIGVGQHR